MTITLNPYLNFAGNAREAMTFYHDIFGGTLQVIRFGDYQMEPAEGTMHASLQTELFTIMASDAMPGAEDTWGGTRNYIALMGDDVETLQGWYRALAGEGAEPLTEQGWGDLYGVATDKYGIEWMFNVSPPAKEGAASD